MNDTEIFNTWKRIDKLNSERTLKGLAEELNVSYSTLRSQRTRNILPNVDILLSISKIFGVSIDFLLTGTQPETKSTYPPRIKKIADKLCNVAELHLLSIESIVDTLPLETVENKAQIS